MRKLGVIVGFVFVLALVATWTDAPSDRRKQPVAGAPTNLGPVHGFVANRGQWPDAIAFAASAAGQWLHVTARGFRCGGSEDPDGVVFTAPSASGRSPTGTAATGAVCNFLRGADPSRFTTGVPVFESVRTPGIAPGVDLVVRAARNDGAAFAYDLHCAAGAQVGSVEFDVTGVDSLAIDATTGELVLALPRGTLRQSPPLAWSGDGADRRAVPCRFEMRGPRRFGFQVPVAATEQFLCIDPDLRWSTTFGGSSGDYPYAIAVAANGDTFLGGTTTSTDLPTTGASFDPTYSGHTTIPGIVGDCFVARFAAGNGALLWCTYLGGSENDQMAVAAAIGNDVVISGWTSSTDYPTTAGAFDTTHNGTGDGYIYYGGDVMVTRLAANGQGLVWSSFLGGALLEYTRSMAVAPNGEVVVGGHVHSLNFPTTPGAFSSTLLGSSDAFVTRFAADGGSLIGSTYFGGSTGEEYALAMALTADDDVVCAGATDSSDLPVTAGAYDPTFNGGSDHLADGFVARFDRTCSIRRWLTYLGTPANEHVLGLAVHFDGSLTCTGPIDGAGLPTAPGVLGPAPLGGLDGFVWRLSGDGATTQWATYVGGTAADNLERAIDLGGGRVGVIGSSASSSMPLSRGSWLSVPPGGQDGLLLVLANDGSAVEYGTALGGPGYENAVDLQRAPDGSLAAIGLTGWGFPLSSGGVQPAGNGDVYVVRVAGLPLGLTRSGDPSGACNRRARICARSGPFVGEAAFALSCGDVPPASPTLAAVATSTLPTAFPVLGFDLLVDVGGLIATPSVAVDSRACAKLPLPIPTTAGLAGAALAVQFVWIDACPGLSFGASDAVAIVVQP